MRKYQPNPSSNAAIFVSEEINKTSGQGRFQPHVLPAPPEEDVPPPYMPGALGRKRNLWSEALLSPAHTQSGSSYQPVFPSFTVSDTQSPSDFLSGASCLPAFPEAVIVFICFCLRDTRRSPQAAHCKTFHLYHSRYSPRSPPLAILPFRGTPSWGVMQNKEGRRGHQSVSYVLYSPLY